MDLVLLAQFSTWSIAQWAIFLLVIAGIIGIVLVVLKHVGVNVPPFIVQIFWIVLAVLVGVFAIKLLVQMI